MGEPGSHMNNSPQTVIPNFTELEVIMGLKDFYSYMLFQCCLIQANIRPSVKSLST